MSNPLMFVDEIEQARTQRSTRLHFWQPRGTLEAIPTSVYTLADLEDLDLRCHQIRVVPKDILKLPRLKQLDLRGNPLEEVPDIPGLLLDWSAIMRLGHRLSPNNVVGIQIDGHASPDWQTLKEFESLRVMSFGHATITIGARPPVPTKSARALIDALSALSELTSVSIRGISLGSVPESIRGLSQLAHLDLCQCRLKSLPSWLGGMRGLRSVLLIDNGLSTIDESIGNVPLTFLDVSFNEIGDLPESIWACETIVSIVARGNQLTRVPAQIVDLPNLDYVSFEENPITIPPPEVLRKGLDAIKRYWRQRREVGVDYLCEAKVLILGEGGAGKTTLARKVLDSKFRLKPKQESTEGIEVAAWTFPTTVAVKGSEGEKAVRRQFQANLWDFGGQEVYHATHQFFLTRRSLYLLVTDDRKEDTDFNYWLQVVELLSDASPLLIVQNEKEGRRREINLGQLRARFPNFRDTYPTNLAKNTGLAELKAAIRQELQRLPHIGTPLPKTWKKVRHALETDLRNHVSLDEYLRLCQDHGFTRDEDKLQLSGYLHDLGICLHFQDDPILRNTVILKPKWGTDAVYRVLDDEVVIANRGRFGSKDLARIWSQKKYAPMRHELLRLMMRFQLCYELPESDEYIAPQFLSSSQPNYEWDSRGNVVLRYEYDFMPKGILTRFIVAQHRLKLDQRLVWKGGMILDRHGTRAEVIEDYPRRQIRVRIVGPDTRGLLAIVDDQLDRIHASFPRLKYEKYLPCSCAHCVTLTDPHLFQLAELQRAVQVGRPIQCRVSFDTLDAADLIRDVLPSACIQQPNLLTSAAMLAPGERSDVKASKEVFVSYAHSAESAAIVDRLQEALAGQGVTLIRDRDEVRYKNSIRQFMQRVGRGRCIVIVLSKSYLESKYCMYELTQVASNRELRERVFPIVLDDANIYDAEGVLDYVAYWERKKKDLDAKIKKVGGERLTGIRDELDLFAEIRMMLDRLVETLADMNALTTQQHQNAAFGLLVEALTKRLDILPTPDVAQPSNVRAIQ